MRDTFYTISQLPDLTGANGGVPSISHEPLNRKDLKASVDIRPPALERDFELPVGNRVLRHVIEPELTYRYVGGIGPQARNVLLFDTTDIVTNTNEAGFSLTQRFYLRPLGRCSSAHHRRTCAATRRVHVPSQTRASGRAGRSRRSSSSTRTSAARSFPAGATSSSPRWI